MINLLDPSLYCYEFPWGNTVQDDFAIFTEEMTEWRSDRVLFHAAAKKVKGWKRDENWNKVETEAGYAFGTAVSKVQYGFGTCHLRCFLPDFRGSWPAFWFIDLLDRTQGGMGIPPEIDVFEQFRKDQFASRCRLTGTYHDGPDYETGKTFRETRVSLIPWDLYEIVVRFTRTPEKMTWNINGRDFMVIRKKEVYRYPDKGMNIVLGAGIGKWNPQVNRFAPFAVTAFSFEPWNG